ncbi:MAG: TRAP transporter fused permease subunit [Dehalococcoidia bacterium]
MAEAVRAWTLKGFSLGLSLFVLYTAGTGNFTALIQRPIVLAFSLGLVLFRGPQGKSRFVLVHRISPSLHGALGFGGVVASLYIAINFNELSGRITQPNSTDILLVGVLFISLFFATRRAINGLAVSVLAAAAVVYAILGPAMPGVLRHPGISLDRLASMTYLYTEGIWGQPLGVAANVIIVFLIFAGVLLELGAGRMFTEIGYALFGKYKGGAAKGAVLGSTLFGTISGSAVANVAAIGPFTIPMMTRSGYSSRFATAVESVASVAGQLVPPVMGAAAFLVADIVGVPYLSVITAAVIPAFLFYLGLLIVVHLRASRLGLGGIDASELQRPREILKDGWFFFLPFTVLIYYLAVARVTPSRAAFWATVSALLIEAVRQIHHGSLNLGRFTRALMSGTMTAAVVSVVLAILGIVIGVISVTGLGLNLSAILVSFAGGNLFVLLIVTAVASIILGTALPTSPTYLILAILVAPAIAQLGVPVLAAHLFVLYYGIIGDITPPTAMTVQVASQISDQPFIRTTLTACWLAIFGFVLPFLFIYNQELIMSGTAAAIIFRLVIAVIGVTLLAFALEGFSWRSMQPYERMIAGIGATLMGFPTNWLALNGIGLAIMLYFVARYLMEKRRPASTVVQVTDTGG